MKPSTYIPALLLAYLAVMAYLGRFQYQSGNRIVYIVIIGLTLMCIAYLHFFLKRHKRRD